MRVLIVSFLFPPYNTIGAARVGKLARWLHQNGNDVRVLAAESQLLDRDDRTLPLEIPEELVTYTPWFAINRLGKSAMRWFQRPRIGADPSVTPGKPGGQAKQGSQGDVSVRSVIGPLRWLAKFYLSATNVPDGEMGWIPYGVGAGKRLGRDWKPEIIVGSMPPASSLVVAWRLARWLRVPWVADLRDPWSDNQFKEFHRWRNRLDRLIERPVLRSASALVSVSEPLVARVAEKYPDTPTCVIYNGYDPVQAPAAEPGPEDERFKLRIIFTGMIVTDHNDITPLFTALRELDPDDVVLRLFLRGDLGAVEQMVARHDVSKWVEINPPIPYTESLRQQRGADALLFLIWTDLSQTGILTGKLFEYMGSGRPILAVGPGHDAASDLIRQHALGLVSDDPGVIAEQLRAWIDLKKAGGVVPGNDRDAVSAYTRDAQNTRYGELLQRVIDSHHPSS